MRLWGRKDPYILATTVLWRHGRRQLRSVGQADRDAARCLVEAPGRPISVDLYQCHRYDTNTPLDETMECTDQGGEKRQDALRRFSGMVAAEHRRCRSRCRTSSACFQPAAIFAALATAGSQSHSAVGRQRHLADRLGRRWPRACSPANTIPTRRRRWHTRRIRNMGGAIKGWMETDPGSGAENDPHG